MAEKEAKQEPDRKATPRKNLKKLAVKKRIEVVKRFTGIVREKFGQYTRAVIVFGSFARGDFKSTSDIDVLVIVDDTVERGGMPPEVRDRLHRKLSEIAAQMDKKLHIQLHLVTEFWDYIRHGDAIFYNFVREGVPVYDSGFFKPIKKLLLSGAIRPTREAVWKQMDGAKSYLKRVDKYMEWSAERLFRAASWSGNGALMALDMPPARPKEIGGAIEEHLLKPGLIDAKYIETYNTIFALHKDIEHETVAKITPQEIGKLQEDVEDFCKKMEEISDTFLKKGDRAKQLKDKLRNTAKVFWLYEGGKKRGYAWIFEKEMFVAIYVDKNIKHVWVAPVSDKMEVGKFEESEPPLLFKSIEGSTFVPVIGQGLVQIILNSLDKEHKTGIIRVGVEFPSRAVVDLTPQFVKGAKR